MVEAQINQFESEINQLEEDVKTGYEILRKKEKRLRILKKAKEQLARLNKRLNDDEVEDDIEE